jgi:hypothetical protein
MKVGGYVRAQLETGSGSSGFSFGDTPFINGGKGVRDVGSDFAFTNRAVISSETRQQTGYGTLRTYLSLGMDTQTSDSSGAATTAFFAERAYIQIAGFTVGLAQSFFDIYSYNNLSSYSEARASGNTRTFGAQLFAYTMMLGNGVSLTGSLENPPGHFRAGVIDGSQASWSQNGVVTTDNAKLEMPDIVGALRIDQAWGYAGVSGVIHQVSGGYYQTSNNQNNGHPDDRYGWAVAAGGQINLPWGDTFGANFVYSKGASGYATSAGQWQIYGNGDGGNTVGVGWLSDGVFDTGTDIELTRVWSVIGAYEHIWNPNWRTSVYGGYVDVSYNDAAKTIINSHLPGAAGTSPCGVPVAGAVWPPLNIPVGSDNSCTPDFSFYQVGTRTQWNPVAGLDVGLDVLYTHLNSAYKGTAVGLYGANGSRPAAGAVEDQDIVSAIFRVQRSFVP